jgi:hypothetical protein
VGVLRTLALLDHPDLWLGGFRALLNIASSVDQMVRRRMVMMVVMMMRMMLLMVMMIMTMIMIMIMMRMMTMTMTTTTTTTTSSSHQVRELAVVLEGWQLVLEVLHFAPGQRDLLWAALWLTNAFLTDADMAAQQLWDGAALEVQHPRVQIFEPKLSRAFIMICCGRPSG